MKKFLSITLSLLLAASAPLSALAETYDLAQGSITVEARTDGNQYVSQENGVQNELQTTETVINQTDSDTTSTDNTITIKAEKNQTAEVTISDVNIDVSGTGGYDQSTGTYTEGKAAISTEGDGNVTIELDGDNTAKSGNNHAGVEKNNGGNLTITDADGDGALEAVGGIFGAGIGGGNFGVGRNITISGNASVEANGGNGGAGIGGGSNGIGFDIGISGNAEVIASGGSYGAGIGGGSMKGGANIIIYDNAEVIATGGDCGAGIGGGFAGGSFNIIILEGAQVGVQGGGADDGRMGAGIGGGGNGYDNGSEATPDTNGLTTGSIGYYAPGADKSKEAPEKLLHNDGSGVHTHTGVTLQSSTEATCLNNAVVTYLCSCGTAITTELLGTAMGHKLGAYTSDGNASCVADGTKTARCIHTGCTYSETIPDAGSRDPNKHSFTKYTPNNDATCFDAGHKTASCDNGCGATDVKTDENAPALGHTWGTYESGRNATCEQDGTKTAKCIRYGKAGCTATDTVTDKGSALKHDFKDYISDGNATCEQDGTKTAKCVRYGKGGCTATDTVTDVDSKLGHDFTDYIYNDDASYTEDGTETAHCNHAGCTKTDTRRAEETRWAAFQVKDEKGWYLPYTESRSGNVLTITVNQSVASLSGTIAGLQALQSGGIETIIFKTAEAESTFNISDLLAGTNYTLTHQNTNVTFTLDGNDIANFLK